MAHETCESHYQSCVLITMANETYENHSKRCALIIMAHETYEISVHMHSSVCGE